MARYRIRSLAGLACLLVEGCGGEPIAPSPLDLTLVCTLPAVLCSRRCGDPQPDPGHCGGGGMACAADEKCVGGKCAITCPAGQTACLKERACADLSSDARHCGDCGRACGVTQVCSLGVCVSTCAEGLRICSGSCVDL